MIELGVKAKDKLTGFEGVVYGRAQYLTGCDQYILVPEIDKDGKVQDNHWFDEGRLQIIGSGLTEKEVEAPKRGGPNCMNPNR